MPASSSNTLALVVIARNESARLARCLNSARPHVDRMLVLDTGSSDDTVAIARQCGAEVHHFTWVDDFSAARNAVLALADADWNLVLDADEWIDDWGLARDDLAACPPCLGLLLLRDIEQSTGQDLVQTSWIPRLLPRGVRYAGRIHEQPVADLPLQRLPIAIHHDGYTQAALAQKKGRNRALLQAELAHTPDNPYVFYQLGKDHEVYGELDAAAAHYLQALARLQGQWAYEHDLTCRAVSCLSRAGQVDAALQLVREKTALYDNSPDFHFIEGNALLDKAVQDPAQAVATWLPQALAAWQRCLQIGEQPGLDGAIHGRGSFLAQHNIQVVQSLMREMPPTA